MKNIFKQNNRKFKVGLKKKITITDIGSIELNEDELLKLISKEGIEHNLIKKDFGYYLTESINKRLINNGYKVAITKNNDNLFFIMLVEISKIKKFEKYLIDEKNTLVCWLPNKSMLDK